MPTLFRGSRAGGYAPESPSEEVDLAAGMNVQLWNNLWQTNVRCKYLPSAVLRDFVSADPLLACQCAVRFLVPVRRAGQVVQVPVRAVCVVTGCLVRQSRPSLLLYHAMRRKRVFKNKQTKLQQGVDF